jgi:CubicO group peptidase (beta-lactamase class C family)
MNLPSLIRVSGPFGIALAILGGVILALSIRAAVTGLGNQREGGAALKDQANAILFWGSASAILGFLGQCHGTYLALGVILSAPEISPSIVAEGFAISFIPTLFGLALFAFSFTAWAVLRAVPGGTARSLPLFLAPILLASAGCNGGKLETPVNLTEGVWVFDASTSVFLWEFSSGADGHLSCLVHELVGGLKYMETPCASVELDGEHLQLTMPNGVRYDGLLDRGRGSIDGSLLYSDGGGLEAPFVWAPAADFPDLQPRPMEASPFVYSVPVAGEDGWNVSHAADRGVDPAALENTVEAILRGEAGFLKSLLVARGEALLLEEYFHGYGPDDLAPILSCTKGVSSLLVGLAVDQGYISGVHAPLLDFFPNQSRSAGSGWGDLTLEHLLTMSMALDWSPEEVGSLHGTGPAAFQKILSRNVVGQPGKSWEYVSMNVNLLAGVLHHATGEHAEAFARSVLFDPLGISEWDWGLGRTGGFNLMDGSLRLRPRDMTKIGVLALNGGEWKGRRVVGKEWIDRSLSPLLSTGSEGEGYGYLWWTLEFNGPGERPGRAAFANGLGSQFIMLFPELDLVVVTTGGNQENGKHMAIGEVLLRELLPSVTAEGHGELLPPGASRGSPELPD